MYQIGVIGDSDDDETRNKVAEEVGRWIAKKGHILICGGRGGVMMAACKGAFEEGGITVGILPSMLKEEANPYCKIVIPTGMGYIRNGLNVLAMDGVIVIGGKAGTLSEIAYAWVYNKPIVAFSNIEGWSSKLAGQKIDYRRNDIIYPVKSPKEAVNKIIELIEQHSR